jgi:hypothetical protein
VITQEDIAMARPTHKLVVKRRAGDEQGRPIGVGWENDKGWISIKLNPCVVISHNDDVYLNLYPVAGPEPSEPTEDGQPSPPPPTDDDIPF